MFSVFDKKSKTSENINVFIPSQVFWCFQFSDTRNGDSFPMTVEERLSSSSFGGHIKIDLTFSRGPAPKLFGKNYIGP